MPIICPDRRTKTDLAPGPLHWAPTFMRAVLWCGQRRDRHFPLTSPRLSNRAGAPVRVIKIAARHLVRCSPQGPSRETVNGLTGAVIKLPVDDVSSRALNDTPLCQRGAEGSENCRADKRGSHHR